MGSQYVLRLQLSLQLYICGTQIQNTLRGILATLVSLQASLSSFQPPPREADELICFPSSSSDPSHLCHSGKTLAPVLTTPPPMAIIPGYFIVLSNDLAHILASGSWTFA